MGSFPRDFSLLAATAVAVAVLSGPVPSFAAEGTAVATGISAKTSAPHAVKRHAPARLSYHVRPVIKPAESYLGCSGAWCGRQFVLMVGIGY
jgi:hypothetical protein